MQQFPRQVSNFNGPAGYLRNFNASHPALLFNEDQLGDMIEKCKKPGQVSTSDLDGDFLTGKLGDKVNYALGVGWGIASFKRAIMKDKSHVMVSVYDIMEEENPLLPHQVGAQIFDRLDAALKQLTGGEIPVHQEYCFSGGNSSIAMSAAAVAFAALQRGLNVAGSGLGFSEENTYLNAAMFGPTPEFPRGRFAIAKVTETSDSE